MKITFPPPPPGASHAYLYPLHAHLDGFIAGPNGELDWATMSPEMDNSLMPAMMEQADTCLIGRVLYEGFASYWPDAPANNPNLSQGEIHFTGWIEQAQKVVFSTTLEKAEWHNSRRWRGWTWQARCSA